LSKETEVALDESESGLIAPGCRLRSTVTQEAYMDPSDSSDASTDATSQTPQPSSTKLRNALITAVVLLIVTIAGGVAGYITDYLDFHKPSAEAERKSTTPTTATTNPVLQPVRVAITEADGPVPRCVTVTGTATPSGNATIWLAENAPEDKDYYGELTKATPDPSRPGGWRARLTLGVGSEINKQFIVYAFALGDESTSLLDHIKTSAAQDGVDSYYFLDQLPQRFDSKRFDSKRFQRNDGRDKADTAACP